MISDKTLSAILNVIFDLTDQHPRVGTLCCEEQVNTERATETGKIIEVVDLRLLVIMRFLEPVIATCFPYSFDFAQQRRAVDIWLLWVSFHLLDGPTCFPCSAG